MRFGRLLILASILLIVAFVGNLYLKQKKLLVEAAPKAPTPLDLGLEARGNGMCHTQYDGDRKKVEVCAEKYRQVKEPSLMELDKVELKLYRKEATEYDLVKTDTAQFDIAGKSLYSDGAVEITMGLKADDTPGGRILNIRTSGVHFSSDTGKAETGRHADFKFDSGSGSATGADYDPNTRELHFHRDVVLHWTGKKPGTKPMEIEAGEGYYYERDSKVLLFPWSKLNRESLHLEAGTTTVMLNEGEIDHADVQHGHGVQDDPGRKVEFAADLLGIHFGDSNVIRHIDGEKNARLVSTSQSARTTVTSDHLDVDFDTANGESTLEKGIASGHGIAEAVPLPQPGVDLGDTRILRSDTIRLKMRPGGREMESAETDGPGTLDFVPNREGQPKRNLKGDRIWIAYGAENRIQSFRSVNVSTRTDKPATTKQAASKESPPPAFTESKEILATFDPTTSELARVEQKTDFHYQEGDRQARASTAVLEQQKDLMTLDGGARVWDPTGSAAADRIVMNQKTGDYTADGHVVSTRQPDKDGKSSAMLSTDEILQARAQHMTSANNNKRIHYEGQAVAWQGANRIEADRLDIDREKQVMEAHGKVVSQFVDKDKDKDAPKDKAGPKPKTAAPIFTVVRAPDMTYHDDTRLAVYSNGATMTRPDLNVAGREIRAYLKDSDSDSSLDKAFADGAVTISSARSPTSGQRRTRTGTSEHAEYYADENKVILEGGRPLLVDSLKGKTTGEKLTWWSDNDRLLVDGEENKPAQSNIRKK